MTNEDVLRATKSSYCLGYREILNEFSGEQLRKYCATTRRHFLPIVKEFTIADNSRWLLRHYLAIKFATAAALFMGSSIYSFNRNILMGVPYFNYYAVLSSCRAFLMTSPLVKWDGSNTVEMTHQKILNSTSDHMRLLDPDRRVFWRSQMGKLYEQRQLFSYRFPLSGPGLVGRNEMNPSVPLKLARLIAELASLNSECFEAVLSRHVGDDMPTVSLPEHQWARAYKLAGSLAVDPDDSYRFGKLQRGWGTVSPLEVMVSDGLMDDLYGSWCDPEALEGSDAFDPDACSRLILRF